MQPKSYSCIIDEVVMVCLGQVAVFAEFRRDWVTALKFYETAYSLLLEVLLLIIQG